MEMRLRAPVTRGYFFLLGALRREISIKEKISSGTQGNFSQTVWMDIPSAQVHQFVHLGGKRDCET